MIIVPLVTAGLLALQFWAEWWAAQALLSTFQDVTKYTIGGIISNLHTSPEQEVRGQL